MDGVFVLQRLQLLIFLLCVLHCVILLVFGGGSFASFSCEWGVMMKLVKECMYTFSSLATMYLVTLKFKILQPYHRAESVDIS